ncbi:MAG: L,D-transpeptidase family protein [Alphaproteobacteria bacterium]|nr:L,D-transpeptidase family protein [Alphaproteobacteria bacterium]
MAVTAYCFTFLWASLEPATAQYRTGTFVDGQPVYAERRRSRMMRLQSRRAFRRKQAARLARKQKLQSVRLKIADMPVVADRGNVTTPPTIPRQYQRVAHALPPRGDTMARSVSETPRTMAGQGTTSSDDVPDARGGVVLPARRPAPRQSVMQIVVSLSQQKLTVYRDHRPVNRTSVSTGKAGHRTPSGIFSVLQKRQHHRSNIYSGAPMPFMQRLTWSGIALHLGHLPGYPASHGCVRLPSTFAKRLYRTTDLRTHVVIADDDPAPTPFSHPNLPGLPDLDGKSLVAAVANVREERQVQGLRLNVSLRSGGAPVASSATDDREREQRQAMLAALLDFDGNEFLAHRRRLMVSRSLSPLRILVTRRTHTDRTMHVQRQLIAAGFDAGDVDGRAGPQTIAAIKDFQRSTGLTATGLPNEETLEALARETGVPRSSKATVYLRQNGKPIYSGPVELAREDEPVGTHLFTLRDFEDGTGAWTALTVQEKGRLPDWSRDDWEKRLDEIMPADARDAIERISFPPHVRAAIEDRLTPGSSLIIADRGSEQETGIATDFIVLTD